MRSALPAAALAVLATMALLASSAHAAPTCDRFASPQGSDDAPGSADAPLRTVQALADALGSGETGCLTGGVYAGDVTITRPGIELYGVSGGHATIVGRLWIAQGADYVTVQNLYLDGANADDLPSPTVNANHAVFSNDDVTNDHTAICFDLGHNDYGDAGGTVIEYSRVHDCGVLPAANHDHGIYVAEASDTTIMGNWIYGNADRGIQLYPDAQNTAITGNVIDSNGEGIIFSGLDADSSDHTSVTGNVITNSKLRYNVESYYDPGTPAGVDNVVTRNCISGGTRDSANGGVASPAVGFTATANVTTAPQFVNRDQADYRLVAGSACAAVDPNSSIVPGPDGGSTSAPQSQSAGSALTLQLKEHKVPRLAPVPMRGKLRSDVAPGVAVTVMVRASGGHWRKLAQTRVHRNGRFHLRPQLRVGNGRHTVRLRAQVRGVARSHSVRLRVRASH